MTAEELDDVSGGMKELIAAFYAGIMQGFIEAGGTVSCRFNP